MKISNLLETATPSSMPDNNTSAPKFGRSDDVLESGVGTSVAGGVASVSKPMGKMQKRGQGSMFQGISTSSKYANSKKAGISEDSVNEDELSEEQLQAKKRREENFKKAKDRELGNKPQSREIMAKEGFNGEYDDEAGMFKNNLQTIQRVSLHLEKAIADNENLPEWCQEKIGVAKSMVVTVMDYMISQHENGEAPTVDEAGPGIPFRGVGGAFNRGDDEHHHLDTPRQQSPQVWGLKINGKVWSKAGKSVTFTSKEAALKSRDSILKTRPDLEIGLVTKGGQQGVAEGWKDLAVGGAMALGALGAGAQTMPDINVKQVELANKYYNVLIQRAKEDGRELDTRTLNVLKAKAQDAAAKKTQQSSQQQGFPSQGSERKVAKDAGQFESQGVVEGLNDDNFTIDDIHQLEQIKDFETLKARAKYLIKGKPARRMKPEKIAYFYDRVDTLTSPMKVIKMMYDLLLAGEGMKTIGSRNSTDPNVYQKRFTEDDTAKSIDEESKGLWANIHAKQNRIKNGSGEHMRKPGSKGAPTKDALRKAKTEDVTEGWQEDSQELEDWSKEVNKRLYRAHESQRPGLARQLSKIEQKNFGSTLNQGGLTELVHAALRAIQKGQMVHYDPQSVGQMAFGSIVGNDARLIAQSGMSQSDNAGYQALKRAGIVDTIQQFLHLRDIANSKGEEMLKYSGMDPVAGWMQFVKDIGWSKDDMNEEVQAKTDDKLLAYYAQRKAEKQKQQGQAKEKCPHCGGELVSEELMNEKKDACYYKVKSRYKVWPSAYASGALVKCRNKGASNWGNGGQKSESMTEEELEESLHDWFTKEKWVRMDTKGNIKGPCAREPGEGKPKCLPQSKAHNLGKKGRASAAQRKRREDPNPDRHGAAINVNTKKKS